MGEVGSFMHYFIAGARNSFVALAVMAI